MAHLIEKSRLRTSLQKCFGTRYAILKAVGVFFSSYPCGDSANPLLSQQDETHSYGFLHRLDVPSSGLVLAAKTYEVQLDVVDGP